MCSGRLMTLTSLKLWSRYDTWKMSPWKWRTRRLVFSALYLCVRKDGWESRQVPKQFKSYVLALLGDRDYKKIVDAVSKINKVFEKDSPSTTKTDILPSGSPFSHSSPCYYHPLPRYASLCTSAGGYSYHLYFPTNRFPRLRGGQRGGRQAQLFCIFCGGNNHLEDWCFKSEIS